MSLCPSTLPRLLLALGLLLSNAFSLRAQSLLAFSTASDLGQLVIADSGNVALLFAASAGTGTPPSGGLEFTPSGTGDDRIVSAWRTQTYGFSTASALTTSALVHLGSITGEEGDFKLGFVDPSGLSAPPTDKDFLKKKGALTYISGLLKYNRKNGQIETLIANKATVSADGSEFSKLTASVTPAQMDAWLRLTLTVTPLPATPGSFSARLLVENLGSDGLAPPTVVRDFTVATLPNSPLAATPAGRVALSLYTKKQPLAQPRLDDWQTLVPGPPPDAPVALAASLIGATQFTAHWSAPTGGVSSYTLEVSTAADNFSPGSLIAADGSPGQSAGFTVPPTLTSATVANLSPATDYVYRLRASNENGPSPLSNVSSVTTLASGVNAPPTLDPISDLGLLAPSPSPRLLTLTGLSPGPGESQPLTVTATSSAPSIVPHPVIAYASPSSTAELSLLASGPALGPVTITVNVSDGITTISRSFDLTVRLAPELLGFADASEYAAEFISSQSAFTSTWAATAGTGTPATGGLQLNLPSATGDRTFVAWRTQPIVPSDATGLSTSLRFRLDGLVKEGEVRVGFVTASTPGEPADKEFLKKTSGPHRSISAFAKLKQDKNQIEIGLLNLFSNGSANESKITLPTPLATLLPPGHWARLTLHLDRSSTTGYTARYVLENLGPDGTSSPLLLAQGAPESFSNPSLATSASAHPVFLVTAKTEETGPFRFDDHEAYVLREAPEAPVALPATERTASSLRATWSYPLTAPFAAGYLLEVSTAADNFAPGSLLSAAGTPGQSTGIALSGELSSFVLSGLQPATLYRYRLRATNSTGAGPLSDVIEAITLPPGGNAPPTLAPLPDLLLAPDLPSRLVPLTGIGTGGEPGQSLTITATSSSVGLLPTPTVLYTSPATTGTLILVPSGGTGTATITVNVSDGFDTTSQTFLVTLAPAPALVGFDAPSELDSLVRTVVHGTLAHLPSSGLGNPASGAAYFLGDGLGTDNGALILRPQDYPAATATLFRTSLVLNPREIDDLSSHRGELRLGFADSITLPAELKKFFEEGRNSVFARFTAEHKPDENKSHLLKVRLGIASLTGGKSEASELSRTDPLAFGHWLRLQLEAVPLDASSLRLTLHLEDLGIDGTATPALLATQTSTFTHPGFLAAARIHAGFFLSTEKTVGTHGLLVDEHRVEVSTLAPSAPLVLPALQITARSFIAAWDTDPSSPPAASYILEVSTAADNFAPGTLIAADGTPGQSTGITLATGALTQRIANLSPDTAYLYRIRGLNRAGPSPLSAAQTVTTLGINQNLPPTLAPIADLTIALGTLDREILLTGISDGGEGDQDLFVYAESSNPALFPDPFILYASPATTAQLFLDPAPGLTGTATITVFVDDGASQDFLASRTFEVSVLSPTPLLRFDAPTELAELTITTSEATLAHSAAAGLPHAPLGALRFERSTQPQDHVAFATRRTPFDARTTGGFTTSLMVNLASVLSAPSGAKDEAELRLGFVTTATPASTLKNTLGGAASALGLTLKLEHEPADPAKLRRLNVQLFGRHTSTSSSSSLTLLDTPFAAHWLRVELHAVRLTEDGAYQLHATVDSYGLDGAAFLARVFTTAPYTVNLPLFTYDDSIFPALQLSGGKNAATAFLIDDYSAFAYTLAPDAPPLAAVTSLGPTTATLNWQLPALGTVATGYIVELSRATDLLAPGTYHSLNGFAGQPSGVARSGYTTLSAAFTGLTPGTTYLWRVRATNGSAVGPAFSPQSFTTAPAPASFSVWATARFTPAQLADPLISGPLADPDGDGLPNLLEYAFTGDPLVADTSTASPRLFVSGNKLRLTYRRPASAPDLTYIHEASGDLNAVWDTTPIVISTSAPDAQNHQTVVIEDAVSLSGPTRARFMRVRVLRPE